MKKKNEELSWHIISSGRKMKRYKKTEILEVIDTLESKNNIIWEKNDATKLTNIIETLTQCQETAILIGTYIETFGDQYAYLVRNLEAY